MLHGALKIEYSIEKVVTFLFSRKMTRRIVMTFVVWHSINCLQNKKAVQVINIRFISQDDDKPAWCSMMTFRISWKIIKIYSCILYIKQSQSKLIQQLDGLHICIPLLHLSNNHKHVYVFLFYIYQLDGLHISEPISNLV